MSGIENFSGFEVIRAAMEVEKQGRRFYAALSIRAQGELTREIFAMPDAQFGHSSKDRPA